MLCSSAAAGVFSVHGAGWWAENTAGAGHCNVLQCSLLCYAHPLSPILALPLTISQSLALSLTLSCPYLYHLSCLPLHCLLIAFVIISIFSTFLAPRQPNLVYSLFKQFCSLSFTLSWMLTRTLPNILTQIHAYIHAVPFSLETTISAFFLLMESTQTHTPSDTCLYLAQYHFSIPRRACSLLTSANCAA